jgi:predicted CXXCH cytochrome family protein
MKRLLFVGAGSALLIVMGGVGGAQADNGPHRSTAGAEGTTYSVASAGASRCASCHRAHTAKASMLLKEAQPALCYTCHGGGAGATTDVQNGTSGGNNAALRGGGFEFALVGAGEAVKTLTTADPVTGRIGHSATVPVGVAEATTSKHQIDGTTSGTMWGNGAISATANPGKAAVTLECGSCHDPHGNGNYRILKPVPNDTGTLVSTVIKAAVPAVLDDPVTTTVNEAKAAVPAVMSAGPAGVAIPDVPADVERVYTTTDYWSVTDRAVPAVAGGVAPAATVTDGYIANASQWCSTCHTRYLAAAPAYETDSGDAVFAYRHTSGRVDKAGVERPNCIQCHVSHGSNAAMTTSSAVGLLPGDAKAPAGDSKLLRIDNRGVCVACHNV